jgi:hypothetical protein
MQNDSDLQTQIHNLSDEELLEMIKQESTYRPEAISYAKEELSNRGGIENINAELQHEEEKKREEYATKPLYLHIPISRLIIMSIISFGLYETYWIYKNWWYLKNRDSLYISPFWRGMFGIFYCHSLLRRIHDDKESCSLQMPSFSPGVLATGWVILVIISALVSRLPGIAIGIISAFIPSFLCLVPVQNYVNSVSDRRNPGQPHYHWSSGHIVCLVFGIIIWALFLIGLVTTEM